MPATFCITRKGRYMPRIYYTEKQNQYAEKYKKANIERIVIQLNKNTDKDLIERRDALKSLKQPIQAELKAAWREYLQNH